MRGPIGKGLQVHATGKHIAFTTGTGVLPFLDLIAHLILKLLERNGGPAILSELQQESNRMCDIEETKAENVIIDLNNFSLELHTSFETEDEAIGLDLINLLSEMTQKIGMTSLFYHNMRIGSRDEHVTDRYDSTNLYAKFQEYENFSFNIRKVWACGTPLMQEHFENAVRRLDNPRIIY